MNLESRYKHDISNFAFLLSHAIFNIWKLLLYQRQNIKDSLRGVKEMPMPQLYHRFLLQGKGSKMLPLGLLKKTLVQDLQYRM